MPNRVIASNETPADSVKMNKMSVTSWTNQAAIDTTKIEEGSILYLQDKKGWFGVKSVSPLTLVDVGGGGGMGDYPELSWKNAKDHFVTEDFGQSNWAGSGNNYDTPFNASGVWSHHSSGSPSDEYWRHSIKQINGLATGGQGGKYATYVTFFHTKRDIDLQATKCIIEMRFKLGLRVSSFKHYFGLSDADNDTNVSGTHKAVFAEINGNFLLRTSGGTESDLDSGTAGDTSVHVHKMVWQSSQIEYFIDGVSKGIKTTNLPAVPLRPIFWNQNGNASTQTSNDIVDYWHGKME